MPVLVHHLAICCAGTGEFYAAETAFPYSRGALLADLRDGQIEHVAQVWKLQLIPADLAPPRPTADAAPQDISAALAADLSTFAKEDCCDAAISFCAAHGATFREDDPFVRAEDEAWERQTRPYGDGRL